MYVEACRVASGSVRPKNDVKFCRKNENVPLFFCTRVQACNYVFWPHSWVALFVNLSRYIIMYVEACRVASGSVRPKNDVKFCRKNENVPLFFCTRVQACNYVFWPHSWVAPFVKLSRYIIMYVDACRVASGSVRPKNDVKFCP